MITALDKNTALVLIDLQKGIVGLPLATPITDILENAAKLVSAFRKANLPIVIVNVNPAGAKWLNSRKEPSPAQNRPFKEIGWRSLLKLKQNQMIFLSLNIHGVRFLKQGLMKN
ncbi:MAG: cysteine hydrolase family protein [Ferruginibacter sp.]